VTALASPLPRAFARCEACGLSFVLADYLPTRAEELATYELHENAVDDPAYRAFLERVALPLVARLTPGMHGLDYGSGPGPALAAMLTERGYPMQIFDPFYAYAPHVLQRTYDFVTCTETVEHFHHPAAEFERLASLLAPRGWLAVMTSVQTPTQDFASWHYTHDPTHVCFYEDRTFAWLAARHHWRVERPSPNVALFQAG
jgi:SAM-dependent methyltransferase